MRCRSLKAAFDSNMVHTSWPVTKLGKITLLVYIFGQKAPILEYREQIFVEVEFWANKVQSKEKIKYVSHASILVFWNWTLPTP